MKNINLTTVLLSLLFLTVSCSKAPIDRETFAKAISEIYLVDNSVDMNRYSVKIAYDSLKIYEPILQKYNLDSEKFMQCYRYYLNDPEELYKVYSLAQDILEKEKERVNEIYNAEKKMKEVWKKAEMMFQIKDTILDRYSDLRSLRWTINNTDSMYYRINVCDSIPYRDIPSDPEWWANNMTRNVSDAVINPYDLEKLKEETDEIKNGDKKSPRRNWTDPESKMLNPSATTLLKGGMVPPNTSSIVSKPGQFRTEPKANTLKSREAEEIKKPVRLPVKGNLENKENFKKKN